MSSRQPERRAVTPLMALLWLVLVTGFLGLADLSERLWLYDVRRADQALARRARRPLKDTALSALHALPGRIEVPPDVPLFDFYFKPEDEELLRACLTRVQQLGTHDDLTRTEIPARLEVEGQDFDVRVKLRGRQYYHVVAPRPSLRVQLRHGRSYRGASVFNLIDPFDKTGDQVFLWESLEHGLIGWDTTMGVVALNGEPLAVVQYVEQPRIAMGDHAGRPEGMFFRPGKGRGIEDSLDDGGEIYSEGGDPERCGRVVERVIDWCADTQSTIGFEEMEELFDLERLRWFTALTEFSGDGHGFADFNMKGYCDPVSLKAEFLIWDTRFGDWSRIERSQFPDAGTQFLRCDPFRARHDQALYALATERLEPMLARVREFFERHGELLAQDPMYRFPRGGPDGGFMRERPEKLERTLRANAAAIRTALTGSQLAWHADPARGQLSFATSERGSKLVRALRLRAGDGPEILPLEPPVTVYGRFRERAPVVVLALPPGVPAEAVEGLVASNLCTGAELEATRSDAPLVGLHVPAERGRELPALPPLPAGFSADARRGEITVGPGELELPGSLSLPRGWRVAFRPGTTLSLPAAAYLEIRGDLSMPGTAAQPIVVRPAGAEPWGALAVLGERTSPLRVELAHTTFSGGAGSNDGSVRCTGSVAIYFADLALDHVTVERNTSEDAINPKFCTVAATDCLYRDGASDAVDYDFCTGTDVRTRIERFGNDGIDVSGSRMQVQGTVVRDVGDKGFSIGEGSRPEYRDITVIGARTGVAIKDRSDASIQGLTVVRCDTAFFLYVKKPSFGPSRARIEDLMVLDSPALAVIDHGCRLELAGALRLGPDAAGLRPFEGLVSSVEPGIGALDEAALLELARNRRASAPPADSELLPERGY
jgi:hypothetical protein